MGLINAVPMIRRAYADPATGLAARAREVMALSADDLAEIGAKDVVRAQATDVRFVRWTLANAMQPTNTHNVSIVPTSVALDMQSSAANVLQHFDSVRITFETFAAEGALREATILVYAPAALMVARRLPEYSAAHGGTIQEIGNPTMQIGELSRPSANSALSVGFILTIPFTEWSAV